MAARKTSKQKSKGRAAEARAGLCWNDSEEAAQAAGLRFVSDDMPGISRRRSGKGFAYRDHSGEAVREPRTLQRIRALAVPPAWTDVWICASPAGHVQATGRDARGRKQYRYHPRWRDWRDQDKYGRLPEFARALPRIRSGIDEHLSQPGLPRSKVLAAVLRLLETSLIRVGNEEYARANDSYGLTTLRDEHVEIAGSALRFEFRGKSGVEHTVDLRDRRLARIVRGCQDLPGQSLFQYVDGGGEQHVVTSSDVNDYLRELAGESFSAKDFRTWAGTVLAARALAEAGPASSEAETRRNIVGAVDVVAAELRNTRAVCRKCYIHPAVLAAYEEGALGPVARAFDGDAPKQGLSAEERAVLKVLEAFAQAAPR